MRTREEQWRAVAVGVGALWVLACGATTSRSEPQGQAGAAVAGRGGAVAGEAGNGGASTGGVPSEGGVGNAAGGGGAVVVQSPLEPGTCGIVRTLALPQPPDYLGAAVTRQGTSFALGPWKLGDQATRLQAFVVDEGGAWRSFEASGSTNDVSWSTLLVEPDLALDVFVGSRAGDEDPFDSRTWSNREDAPSVRGNVVESIWRGSDTIALVPTLDGQRALFAIWPHGLSAPRAAVIGTDGARQGESHTFSAPDHVMRCTAVTPTAHGGFVSFVDSNGVLRLSELGAQGQLVREVTWPMPSAGYACPAFALAEGGLAFLLDRAAQDAPPDRGLYRLGADGAVEEVPASLAPEAREVAMLGDDPLVLRWSPQGAELSQPLQGELWLLTLPRGAPKRVASEPGNIVLDFDSPEEGRTVVQISCR